MGALTGAFMGSPLGAIGTGIGVGIVGFTQSVGNDLFDNEGDWSQVNWGKATIVGFLSGIVSGIGKGLKVPLKKIQFNNATPIIPIMKLGIWAFGGIISLITAGARSGVKAILNFIFSLT